MLRLEGRLANEHPEHHILDISTGTPAEASRSALTGRARPQRTRWKANAGRIATFQRRAAAGEGATV